MGYCADGNGIVILKNDINIKKLRNELIKSKSNIEYTINNNMISLEEYSFSWSEENTYNFLNTLKPYIKGGVIKYRSIDDDRHWRYVYDPITDKWEEEMATTSYDFEEYTDNELIEELKKRGYVVKKSNIEELVIESLQQIIED